MPFCTCQSTLLLLCLINSRLHKYFWFVLFSFRIQTRTEYHRALLIVSGDAMPASGNRQSSKYRCAVALLRSLKNCSQRKNMDVGQISDREGYCNGRAAVLSTECFTFGDPIPVLDRRELLVMWNAMRKWIAGMSRR